MSASWAQLYVQEGLLTRHEGHPEKPPAAPARQPAQTMSCGQGWLLIERQVGSDHLCRGVARAPVMPCELNLVRLRLAMADLHQLS